MQTLRVLDVMTPDPATCLASDAATAAARIMWELDCGAVPVMDDRGRLVGMVTDRDLCMAVYTRGHRLEDLDVESVMARPIVTCRPEDTLVEAARRMGTARVRRLPVVAEDGTVRGLLSINDLVRARSDVSSATDGGLLGTLASIGRARAPHPIDAE